MDHEHVVVVVVVVIVGIWLRCCYRCYLVSFVLLSWFRSSTVYGLVNYSVDQIFPDRCFLHFCSLISASHPGPQNPTHPPGFIAPAIENFVVIPKMTLIVDFCPFLPVKQSKMNRFWNGFQLRIASGKLYNIAAESLSRHEFHKKNGEESSFKMAITNGIMISCRYGLHGFICTVVDFCNTLLYGTICLPA